jgi:hypothetical protein
VKPKAAPIVKKPTTTHSHATKTNTIPSIKQQTVTTAPKEEEPRNVPSPKVQEITKRKYERRENNMKTLEIQSVLMMARVYARLKNIENSTKCYNEVIHKQPQVNIFQTKNLI